jgi:hypothetical protein
LLTLDQGFNSSRGGPDSHLAVGYPIDGIWVRPLAGYADANQNGTVDISELVFNDSALYFGTQDAPLTASFSSRVGLWNGRLSLDAMFTYESGATQYNAIGLAVLQSAANAPGATLEQQAIFMATQFATNFNNGTRDPTPYLYQQVNMLRWQSASLRYMLPASFARVLRGQTLSVSVQGDNLWLHTNYRGKDPNVNAILSGEGVSDLGQIPQPRRWVLRVNLTN